MRAGLRKALGSLSRLRLGKIGIATCLPNTPWPLRAKALVTAASLTDPMKWSKYSVGKRRVSKTAAFKPIQGLSALAPSYRGAPFQVLRYSLEVFQKQPMIFDTEVAPLCWNNSLILVQFLVLRGRVWQ